MKKNELFLLFLLKNFPGLNGAETAKTLAVPQQTVSRWTKLLHREGFIERSGQGFALTMKGREYLTELVELQPFKTLSFTGLISGGLHEGAYYMSQEGYWKQIKEKLGFKPFAGTINLKLSSQKEVRNNAFLREKKGIILDSFKEGNRFFGGVYCFKAKWKDFEGAVIIPMRTHHDASVMEVIFPIDLRTKGFALKKGDEMTIKVEF